MFEIKEENSIEVAREVFSLMIDHYYEVEDKAEKIPFNVNWATLETFFKVGIISLVVARKDGIPVGYFANILAEDFMTSEVEAKELGIYIDPAYRGGRLFFKLLKKVEEVLTKKGVKTQYITFKAGHNTELPLRCGFTHTETTYQKILEE